jgi:hypothetical protein
LYSVYAEAAKAPGAAEDKPKTGLTKEGVEVPVPKGWPTQSVEDKKAGLKTALLMAAAKPKKKAVPRGGR